MDLNKKRISTFILLLVFAMSRSLYIRVLKGSTSSYKSTILRRNGPFPTAKIYIQRIRKEKQIKNQQQHEQLQFGYNTKTDRQQQQKTVGR